MKRIVIGTAGHIDHGKTKLTQALTGVDCDRLAEEKARGITIELGFAPLNLPDGTRASIVDVPGHERFVKTMMAGASGIDLVLLVIAADEGVMPQTKEHLDILRLLDIKQGILVVTKTDLVDDAQLHRTENQIRAAMEGTFLEEAPMVPVSVVTGQGIPELVSAIVAQVPAIIQRSQGRPVRLPVDRVTQVEGFGSVATGTLTEGRLQVGDLITVYPGGASAAVRSLQNHQVDQQESLAGMRTAVSLTGFSKGSLNRGDTIAEPDSMLVGEWLDVRLQIIEDCPYQIKNSSRLHLFHGTSEVVCQVRLLNSDKLTAGQSAYAQLKLASPLAVRNGDRFVLRFFSPVLTIGGGVILDGSSRRRRRNHPEVLERLKKLDSPELPVSLLQRIEDGDLVPQSAAILRRINNETPERISAAVEVLSGQETVVELLPGNLLARSCLEGRWSQLEKLLSDYHQTYPLQPGMRVAELRSRGFPETEAPVDQILAWYVSQGRMKREKGYASLAGFVPVFTDQHKIMQRKLLHYYRDAWFQAPNQADVDAKFQARGPIYPQTLTNMRLNGMLISLTPRYAVHFEAYWQALEIFCALFEKQDQVTLAEFRTAAGISRKYAQLFLEHWDRQGYCRRVGDARILLRRPEQ